MDLKTDLGDVQIKSVLKMRDHKFTDGPGKVANKLIIEIDFANVAIQTHTHFEDQFTDAVKQVLEDEIAGYIENLDC